MLVAACCRAGCGVAFSALLVLAAAGPTARAQGTDPPAPPVTADSSIPGSELEVYLMTMGQGDLIWERFGHNAIGIRNQRSGEDLVYNWGLFSFQEPGFVGRFLRGDLRYWMAPFDAAATTVDYVTSNRSVSIQELNLSPPQRLALLEFVRWNAQEENRFYAYDYFRDNCSTRVRDALDRILGGQLRRESEGITTDQSYRDHALRLLAEDLIVSTGVDIGLGRPSDRLITAWEEMFIPMRLRDRLRTIRVPDEAGRMVPLVTAERVVFEAARPAERPTRPARAVPMLVVGAGLAAGLWWLLRRALSGNPRARRAVLASVAGWSVVMGLLGAALLLLRVATRHEWAWDNTNLFVYNPLWLVLAVLLVVGNRSAPVVRTRDLIARVAALLSVAGLLLQAIPSFRQDSPGVMLLALPVNLVAAWAVRQLRPAPPVVETSA
jgi:hypothetical protein